MEISIAQDRSHQWSTRPAHSPGRQWLSLDFEVLGRTDGRTLCVKIVITTGRTVVGLVGQYKIAKQVLIFDMFPALFITTQCVCAPAYLRVYVTNCLAQSKALQWIEAKNWKSEKLYFWYLVLRAPLEPLAIFLVCSNICQIWHLAFKWQFWS